MRRTPDDQVCLKALKALGTNGPQGFFYCIGKSHVACSVEGWITHLMRPANLEGLLYVVLVRVKNLKNDVSRFTCRRAAWIANYLPIKKMQRLDPFELKTTFRDSPVGEQPESRIFFFQASGAAHN